MNDKDLYEELVAMTADRDQWVEYALRESDRADMMTEKFCDERAIRNYYESNFDAWRPQGMEATG